MRVGILTFSAAHNFGAILQCYGLYKTVRALGYSVEVIDYRPDYLRAYKPVFGIRQFLSRDVMTLSKRWDTYRYWRKVYDGYMNFKRDEILMTKPVFNHDEIIGVLDDFDKVIVGSDQIWNRRFNGNDEIWYGVEGNRKKWCAYAASVGDVNIWATQTKDIKYKLNHFSHIGVREREIKPIVDEMTGNESLEVLDPSLLADPAIWRKWERPIISNPYILVYQARESDDVFRIAEALTLQFNSAEIIPIDFYGNVTRLGYKTRITSPGEFISLIKNAQCVITTSFHGTAFSIVLNTPFYTVRLNDGGDSRAENLLSMLGISNRMIDKHSTPRFSNISFSESNSKLNSFRQSSLNFLKMALAL